MAKKADKDDGQEPTQREAEGLKQLITMMMQLQKGMKEKAPTMYEQMAAQPLPKKPG